MSHIDGFRKWLENEGYRPGTVRKTSADLVSYIRNPSIARPASSNQRARDYYRAWLLWEEYRGVAGIGPIANLEGPPQPVKPRRRVKRRKRQMEAESVSIEDWERLRAAAKEDGSPAALVILVIMGTGLRIADVLRVTVTDFSPDTVQIVTKGGVTRQYPLVEEWKALRKQWDRRIPNVAALVCKSEDPNPEADGPAYRQVARTLKKLAQKVGVEGRVHLHRLRRSVATQLLRKGARIEEVQRVLGHTDIRTTQGYVDEQMPDLVRQALERLKNDDDS